MVVSRALLRPRSTACSRNILDRAYVKILPAILRHFEVANSLADENSGVPHQNRPNCRKWLLVRKEYYPAIIETTVQVH